MQPKNSLLIQNIAGRITHGLIGLEIFLNEKKVNDYLKDFLTLKKDEIKEALTTTFSRTGLIPTAGGKLSDEEKELVECVGTTQQLILALERAHTIISEEKIEHSIAELGTKLDVIYAAVLPE